MILFHYVVVQAYTLLCYGFALTNSTRKDLVTTFGRLMAEILDLAKDGTEIMIEYYKTHDVTYYLFVFDGAKMIAYTDLKTASSQRNVINTLMPLQEH